MQITIQEAKNGELTARAENHFLHSNYAPLKEAERFVENLTIPYEPSKIIVTEPALSYIAPLLKKKFPKAKLGAIRYYSNFTSYNKDFDFVLNYFEHKNFETYLESIFTEEDLLTSYFTSWSPSSQIFKDEDTLVWNAIKAAMLRAKTLLITRQYFEKKWFLNSCTFIKNLQTSVSLNTPVNKDALIISSGPSLIPYIDTIKENQNKFFIICLSSAISVCIKNGIKPDLCMSTDGGYWAGEHLKVLYKNDIPLAMPAEAYCKASLTRKLSILPLNYEDGISSSLLEVTNIKTLKAVRNGTVSGTALLFAYTYCRKNIYLCGMDMASQKGFQHAQPNQLELNSAILDNRIKSKMTRLSKAGLGGGSLDIYKDWFINNPLDTKERKIYRLIEKENRQNSLGWIKDIGLKDFEIFISKINDTKADSVQLKKELVKIKFKDAVKILSDNTKTNVFKQQFFPLDYVQALHDPQNKDILVKIENEWKQLKEKAERILNADL